MRQSFTLRILKITGRVLHFPRFVDLINISGW